MSFDRDPAFRKPRSTQDDKFWGGGCRERKSHGRQMLTRILHWRIYRGGGYVVMPMKRRKAAGVVPELKGANLKRLRRIEGQVRGLQRMVEEDRYCADIIVQVASVQEALRGVARNLMKSHLQHCATKAIHVGKPGEAGKMYEQLLELIYKHLR